MSEKPDPKAELAKKANKVPLRLIPPVALVQCADALAVGAKKYGEGNWREADAARLNILDYVEAIERHCLALKSGLWFDLESGKAHFAHIMAGAAIALEANAINQMEHPKPDERISSAFVNLVLDR